MAAAEVPLSSSSMMPLTNRLGESRSPYVSGHMKNPVAWQMWGQESTALAKKYNRLIFLSIGYAACHWCHVMERESFENDEIARILNNHFVPIKVDREERPDIDRIYMNYVQATTGSGGWPLSLFLTPDLEPVFGGTYWPGPSSNTPPGIQEQVSFLEVLIKMRGVWNEKRADCVRSAKLSVAQLRQFANEGNREGAEATGEGLDLELLEESYQHFAGRFDAKYGGISAAPKFALPVHLSFLLRLQISPSVVRDVIGAQECKRAAVIALTTLQKMTRGGIHDHIGHGFARYSVTRDWSLPHFEKMLYDQAQLLEVYLDAFMISGDPEMLGAVYDIADYLTKDALAAPGGGFYSAEDADSLPSHSGTDKREGAFYVWELKEFDSILSEREAKVCAKFWNVDRDGNVAPENDSHDEFMNQNVLAVVSSPAPLAKEFGLSEEDVVEIIKTGRRKLRAFRDQHRPRPNLDDKIVTSWNGLAIGALARASTALQDIDEKRAADYVQAAEMAATFVRKSLWDAESGSLKRVFREGPGDTEGFADDYANLISGLINLYEATFKDSYLEWADQLQKAQLTQFWDTDSFGFFSTSATANDLIIRLKEGMDSVEPSTNGVSAQNLHRLSALLEDQSYAKYARETSLAFEAEIMEHPYLFSSMMPAIVASALGMRSVILVGDVTKVGDKRHRKPLGPLDTTIQVHVGKPGWLSKRNPIVRSIVEGRNKQPRVMICEAGKCTEETFDEETDA